MNNILLYLSRPASTRTMSYALVFLRVAIGMLNIGHGLPKIMGGVSVWHELGTAMGMLGITFLPTFWGLCAACAEFFGGVAYVVGLGTRVVSLFLIFTMQVAFLLHYYKGDSFPISSFALTLLVIFVFFLIVGSGPLSVDSLLVQKDEHRF